MEIWIYGATIPGGASLSAGDEIAVFSGNILVGLITLTVTPSTTTVWSSHLIAYSKNTSGNNLYTPGDAFTLKCYDVSTNTEYVAYGWGDDEPIDFHNEWWAPTSEAPATSSNLTQGAYFPSAGGYSYCYVNATFIAGPVPNVATVRIEVDEADGTTNIATASVTSGGYTATYADEVYTMLLYAGDIGDTDNYTYTITVSNAGDQTETFDITVQGTNNGGAGWNKHVLMDAYGNLDGLVYGYNLPTDPDRVVVENAAVTITIDGVVYSDNTDATGAYLIENIPDGEWTFSVSYPNHITQEINPPAINNGDTITAADVLLDYVVGTLEGEIFDATTIHLIDVVTMEVCSADSIGAVLKTITTTDGTYSLSYFGGTYDIKIISAGYDTLVVNNHVFYPDYTETGINFNLLPTGTDPEFDTITGDPDKVWSIRVEMAKFGVNSLVPWDELVIFDTDQTGIGTEPGKRVGTLRLPTTAVWQNSGINVLKAFSSFSDGTLGFVTGHHMEFWAYDVSHDAIYEAPIDWWFNAGVGTWSGTTFPDSTGNHISYLNIYWEGVSGELTGHVTCAGSGVDGVLVEVLNVFTHDLISSNLTAGGGLYTVSPLDQSTYDVRFSKTGYNTEISEDVVITGGQSTTRDIVLTSRPPLTWTYSFPASPGFYFIGRALETENGPDMLTLLDYGKAPAEAFTNIRHDSWIENDAVPADRIHYEGGWLNSFDWELSEGYQVFYNHAEGYSFDMVGPLAEPENNPITFPGAGIYYIPYFPYNETTPDEAITAFAGIFDKLDWVMDSQGNRLHHDGGFWVDNIGTMSPTEGYKIKMNAATTLTYPATATKSTLNRSVRMEPEHFVFSGGNAADWTYTIYIETNEFEIGDEIAAFSDGKMVGSMVIDSEDPWENNLNTFYVAVEGGYGVNVPIELIAWDASEQIDYSVAFEIVDINNACYPGTNFPAGLDQFSYARVYRGIVRVDENQVNNSVRVYPNPVNNILNVESVNTINQIKMYNVYGALISNIAVNTQHQQMDVSSLIPGTYLIQITTSNGIITKRVIIQQVKYTLYRNWVQF